MTTPAPALPAPVRVSNGPLVNAAGRPLHRVPITITLVSPLNPFLLNGSGSVIERLTVDTGRTGVWAADLIPTGAYARNDAYYVADETKAGGRKWMFVVPDDGGPYSLHELLIDSPPTGEGSIVGKGSGWVHRQLSASDTWVIEHNLGYAPGGITLLDSDQEEFEAEPVYTNPNTILTIRIPNGRAVSGVAYLS